MGWGTLKGETPVPGGCSTGFLRPRGCGPDSSGRRLYMPSGPDWGLRPTTALTYLVVLAEGVPRAQAQLKLGPRVLGSEPASASWSQARTFFLLPPGRISLFSPRVRGPSVSLLCSAF